MHEMQGMQSSVQPVKRSIIDFNYQGKGADSPCREHAGHLETNTEEGSGPRQERKETNYVDRGNSPYIN
eukprot:1149098-Pelagomonas_calceolata.AAC.2